MNLEIYSAMPPIVQRFLAYNETIKGKSDKSISEYCFDLQTFFRYILLSKGFVSSVIEFSEIDISGVDIDLIKSITLNDLYSFLVYCKNERGNNAATRARKSSTLRIFFRYLTVQEHLLEVNPAELLESPKTKQSLPKHLTLEDSIALLNSVTGLNSARDYCILTLFLNCGMRLSELVSLNVTDIKSDGSIIITGKGNKERLVYLNQACIDAVGEYLKVRPNEGVPYNHKNALFISRNKQRISNKTVQHIVTTYLEKAGLGNMGYSTHKLRHTAATLMYQQGHVDVRVLKEILGHANLGTTQIYTHVANEQVQTAINANPLANVKKKNNSEKAD
ncbi:MAG: tyrosine recombinase XerC [Clostridiales bacterium]|nr:tyrosine recombinase XerC [Candidatus Equinaster intestinalis]